MTTFHVVYTPGTTAALLPLALSLLRAPGGRFVLVDNGCGPDERQHLELVAASEDRFGYYRLPVSATVPHGAALDHLLACSDEPTFGILDSDVVASGDFLADLEPELPGHGAVCAGWPVWLEDAEAVSEVASFVGGPYRRLADGTDVGGTSCALYDRAALELALRSVPAGLESQTADDLRQDVRAAFHERGWRFHRFGTARVAHLQLSVQGCPIVNCDTADLHHLGGVSHVADLDRRRVAAKLIRGTRAPFVNLLANLARRASRDGRRRARSYRRKAQVLAHVGTLMEALRREEPLPPPPETGSAEVDARVQALAQTLIRDYPGYCEWVRERTCR